MKISKKQFNDVYNKYKPNNYIKFIYKHFSKETEKTNFKVRNSVSGVLSVLFIIGFLSVIFPLPRIVTGVAAISYGSIIAIIVLSIFIGVIFNKIRLRKIMKELNVTRLEYNKLVDLHGQS